jgi:two-component sensor histidine kinase
MHDVQTLTGIAAVGPVNWGTHFCQLYDTPADMIDVLVPYFKTGLEQNELCHWVTSEHLNCDDAKSALRNAYPELDRAIARGQITIVNRSEWYQRGGSFDANDVVGGWLANEEQARGASYSGYRLTGDTLWLEDHQWDAFTEYESLVTRSFADRRMIALCTYCMGRCGASEVLDVVNNHAFAVARRRGEWEVVESASTKMAKAELAALNQSLAERVDLATAELRALVSHKDVLLREVHHRVKNNLQIVANLLALKSRSASEEAKRALMDTADRVRSISAVHEALYEGMAGETIALKERLAVVLERLAASYCAGERISMTTTGDDVRLSLNAGVPVALLVTEIASNALKHAFPDGRAGSVRCEVRAQAEGRFSLVVEDDGIGWTPSAAARGSGLGIAMSLARQLEGEMRFEPRERGGTRFLLEAAVQ